MSETNNENSGTTAQEVSKETIAKIRALSAERFEPTFIAQLKAEQKIAMVIVYFMQEAFRRREWARRYSSFSAYCCEHLKMSSSDFYRKYSILRTIEELPELESKILNGDMNSTTVAKISHFLHRESKVNSVPVTTELKRDLFNKLEGLSHRQVEKELASLSPQSALPDKTRQITQSTFVRQFTSNAELEQKIERAKQLLAHSLPQPPTDCQLFTRVTDIALERLDPILRDKRKLARADRSGGEKSSGSSASARAHGSANGAASANTGTGINASLQENANANLSARVRETPPRTKTEPKSCRERVPQALRDQVFKRDKYMCTYVIQETGKYCGSQFALELDHIVPAGQGGDNSLENLRILCRTHNQLRALETYGRKKMATVVKSLDLEQQSPMGAD